MNKFGFTDVVLEAGVMSGSSINGVLSEKKYSRAINCHEVMVESLERETAF